MALTRDTVFWSAFSSHADVTVQATELLRQALEDPSRAEVLAKEITRLEGQGDKITHDTVLALHQTWITPLDREEIHGLIARLDDVLDYVDAASDRIALYDLKSPRADALELARTLCACMGEVAKAVRLLPEMKEAKPILDLCVAINRYEHDADTIYRRAIAQLYKPGNDPLEAMKWRDVMESLETAADRAEDVANIIEGIVLEHA